MISLCTVFILWKANVICLSDEPNGQTSPWYVQEAMPLGLCGSPLVVDTLLSGSLRLTMPGVTAQELAVATRSAIAVTTEVRQSEA